MKQRELKFRAWDGERMILFSNFSIGLNKGKKIKPYVYFTEDTFDGQVRLGSHKIMEWIGLKDKNGKEIYEGDRVLIKKGFDGIVKYNHQRAGFIIEYQQPPLRAIYISEFNVTYGDGENYIDETLEVIGNIYEKKYT